MDPVDASNEGLVAISTLPESPFEPASALFRVTDPLFEVPLPDVMPTLPPFHSAVHTAKRLYWSRAIGIGWGMELTYLYRKTFRSAAVRQARGLSISPLTVAFFSFSTSAMERFAAW